MLEKTNETHFAKTGVSPPVSKYLERVDDQFTVTFECVVLKNSSIFYSKLLKFECQFDLDGQGQGHQFRIHLRHL